MPWCDPVAAVRGAAGRKPYGPTWHLPGWGVQALGSGEVVIVAGERLHGVEAAKLDG